MKIVIQRAKNASVTVDSKIVGKIDNGFVVLLGIKNGDTNKEADYLIKKLINLRAFSDENDKMNLALKNINGKLLIISQFTLYADCSRGNRPSFEQAAKPEIAKHLYEYFCEQCEKSGIEVQRGIFGADMKVEFMNDGPVTIVIEK